VHAVELAGPFWTSAGSLSGDLDSSRLVRRRRNRHGLTPRGVITVVWHGKSRLDDARSALSARYREWRYANLEPYSAAPRTDSGEGGVGRSDTCGGMFNMNPPGDACCNSASETTELNERVSQSSRTAIQSLLRHALATDLGSPRVDAWAHRQDFDRCAPMWRRLISGSPGAPNTPTSDLAWRPRAGAERRAGPPPVDKTVQ
jgi:hypothetical protein